jgi:hypothetical protein
MIPLFQANSATTDSDFILTTTTPATTTNNNNWPYVCFASTLIIKNN